MSFPKYPKYKDSGVEWLGEVPEHWEVWKLKSLSRLESGHTPSRQHPEYWVESECVTPWFTLADVSFLRDERNIRIEETSQKVSALGMENSAARLLPRDTVILSRTASVGFSGIMAKPMAVSQDFGAWICGPRLVPLYLCHCFRAMKGEFRRLMMGSTHQTIYMPDLEAFRVPVPPVVEQAQIAAFIEAEAEAIDELMAEQRRLMELLKEKRQAVISHAVTKGLNSRAPMKPSGIEWLGEVPAHWEVRRVKTVSTFTTSGPRGWSERVGEVGSLFVQSGDLNDTLEVEFGESKRVLVQDDAEAARTVLRNGDVVVCITGAKTGNVAVCETVPETAYVNQHLCLIRPTKDVVPRFLGLLLKSKIGQTYFEVSQYGLKQGLSLEDIKEAPVFLPPLDEQATLVRHLCIEAAKIDTLTAEAQRAIDLLQERRTALISAAVTGQIDVRNLPTRKSA